MNRVVTRQELVCSIAHARIDCKKQDIHLNHGLLATPWYSYDWECVKRCATLGRKA